jgi:hypothetical protein
MIPHSSLYSAKLLGGGSKGGRWEIVEDDEKGTLKVLLG